MASNARFHNKYHRRNHHSIPSDGFPDSGADPIASPQEPFRGDFHAIGALSATGNLTIGGNTLIYGNLSALGDFSVVDTIVTVTSALSVINEGTGPALTVQQKGNQPIAIFFDDNTPILQLKNNLRAEFFNSQATNTYALAEGQGTQAQGNASHAEGNNTIASGPYSHAQGDSTRASGDTSHAEGFSTQASGDFSHAQGGSTRAQGYASHAEGGSTVASGQYGHAEGHKNTASGESSHVEGFNNVTGRRNNFQTYTAATRTFTFNETVSANFNYVTPGITLRGYDVTILNNNYFTITVASRSNITGAIVATADAIGANSSNGYLIDNTGGWAHAEGYNNVASGEDSHAQGYNNVASGDDSHAEGYNNVASGLRSHAQGDSNIASGESSHAQGGGTLASGTRSTASGQFTSATKTNAYASGKLAFANHNRSWVWQGTNQDGASAQFASTRTDQFAIRPGNGFYLSGAMGINTDSIDNALTVNGNISSNGNLTINGSTILGDSDVDTLTLNGTNVSVPNNLNFDTNTLFIDATNNRVGIGTDAPDEKLHVLKASAGTVTADSNSIAVFEGNGPNHITILTPDAQAGGVVFGSPSDNFGSYLTWNHDNNALKLATDKAGGFIQLLTGDEAEAVRITSSGNVGIGTTAPAERLTVNGNISSNGTVFTTSVTSRGIDLIHTPANDGVNPILRMGECTPGSTTLSGFSGAFVSYDEGTNTFGISSVFAPAMGAPAIAVDRNSNVGIGTTLPTEKLTVSGNISANGTLQVASLTSRGMDLIHTPNNDGINPLFRIGECTPGSTTLSAFSGISMSYDEGTNVFGISSVFTPITSVLPALSIDRNNNVGVGVLASSSATAARLTVNGNISALSGVYTIGIQPGVIPAMFKIDGINLLAAVGTRVPIYTVPAGMKFSASGFKLIVTSTDASAPFTIGPSVAINNSGSVSKLINDVVLSTSYTYAAGNIVNQSGGYGGGGASRTFSTDTVGVEIVNPAFAGGGAITTMIASIIVTGELFY